MLAPYHPHIVHFVIALLVVGVVLRLVSLTGRIAFAGPAATTLILVGTIVSVFAVQSGLDAHGPVERIPGARSAVEEHEDWGERTRNMFVIVSLLELVALALTRQQQSRYARPAAMAAAVAGLAGGSARRLWALLPVTIGSAVPATRARAAGAAGLIRARG